MGISTATVAEPNTIGWRFDNTYSRLPGVLFAPARPAHKPAGDLGLDLGALTPSVDQPADVLDGRRYAEMPEVRSVPLPLFSS